MGQDVTTVVVSGAMLSGLVVAVVILKFNLWKEFEKIINTSPY